MSDGIKAVLDHCSAIYVVVDELLSNHTYNKNFPFPDLIAKAAKKLGISNGSEMDELSDQIRYFVRHHPKYSSKKGAGGGITLSSVENKRKANKTERNAAKELAAAMVEEKLAKKSSAA